MFPPQTNRHWASRKLTIIKTPANWKTSEEANPSPKQESKRSMKVLPVVHLPQIMQANAPPEQETINDWETHDPAPMP